MELIDYIPRWNIVMCKKCQIGILMDGQFETHFKRKHQILKMTRQITRDHIRQQHPNATQTEQDLEQRFRYPHHERSIPQIGTHQDGLACSLSMNDGEPCKYVCRTKTGMIEHCQTEHGWVNSQGRGGSQAHRQKIDRPWRENVSCQRLFHHGPRNGYWEVRPNTTTLSNTIQPMSSQAEFAEQMLAQIQEKEASIRARDDLVRPGVKLDANAWLERVGWAEHLQGIRWDTLIEWAALPQDDERMLKRMCRSVDHVVDIAQEAIVDGHCPFFSRFDINKKEAHQHVRKPFQARMEADTKKRYCQVLHRIISYIYRSRHNAEKPPYEMSAPQESAWSDFVTSTAQEEEQEDTTLSEREIEDEDEEDDDEHDPDVVLSPPQKELTPMRPIDRHCLELWIQLFNHRLDTQHYQSVVLSALAAIGVDVEDRTWMGPENYTPKLSAVIKLARMMVALRGVDHGSVGAVERIRRMMKQFMVEDQPVPMSWLFSTRRYGLRIRYTTTAGGTIRWEGDTVSYQNIKFSMHQFRTWVHGLTNECRRIMEEELLMIDSEETMPTIPWETLNDNPSETQPEYDFVQHNAVQMSVDGQKWLFQRIVGDPQRVQEFMTNRQQWREGRIQKFMRAVRRFKEKLLVLMHVSGGQPARAPELLSVRCCNTHTGGRRNVFVEQGQVVFVTAYHKGYAFEGSSKIIHRYLPREVGQWLVYYMWLVQPFERQIEVSQYDRVTSHGFLWRSGVEDPHWTSERVRKLIQSDSMVGMGVKLNISAYRQLAIAITRKYLKGEGFIDDREDENIEDQGETEEDGQQVRTGSDSVFDKQGGHGTHIAGMIYARAILEAPGAVASLREQYRHASGAWHRLLQFGSALQARKRARGEEEDDIDPQFQRWKRMRRMDIHDQLERLVGPGTQFRGVQEASIQAVMSGKGPVVTVMGTGGGKSLLFMLPAACSARTAGGNAPGLTVVVVPMISLREDLVRRCTAAGIRCAPWDSRRPDGGVSIMLVTPESAISKGFQEYLIRMQATKRLERIVIDEAHVVLDSRGDFRPKLQRLSELLMAETQMVMLTATLPPSEEDQLFRCLKLPREVVTMFRAATTRKNVRYQVVERVQSEVDPVVDRAAKRREGATGVAEEEQEEERSEEKADRQIHEIVEAKLREYSQGKIVIYGRSVDRVRRLATRLQCEAYYRQVREKSAVFERITGAVCRVVVATNALGLGIDMPDIRVVIHMDGLARLRDFAQESGRAGRDGGVSESIVVVSDHWGRNVEEEEWDRIERYSAGTVCSRVVLDGYLDGRTDRVGCEEGEELCWICRPSEQEEVGGQRGQRRSPHEPSQLVDIATVEQEAFQQIRQQRRTMREQMQWMMSDAAMAVEEFRRRVEEWSGQCAYCYMEGREEEAWRHGLAMCQAEGVEEVQREFHTIRREIRYGKYCVCFQCGMPQAMCRQFESNGFGRWRRARGQTCQYPDVMMGVFVSVMFGGPQETVDSVLEWMRQDSVEVSEKQAVYRWLGRKISWGEMEAAQINKVFLRLVQSVG